MSKLSSDHRHKALFQLSHKEISMTKTTRQAVPSLLLQPFFTRRKPLNDDHQTFWMSAVVGDNIDAAGGRDDEGPRNYRTMTDLLESALKISDDSLRNFDDEDDDDKEE